MSMFQKVIPRSWYTTPCYTTAMLKLISVNMEGEKHFPRIVSLIRIEDPDIICLQECPESFRNNLQTIGYRTDFLAMRHHVQNDVEYTEGLVFASKLPFASTYKYYYQPDYELPTLPIPTPKHIMHHGYIMGTVEHKEQLYHIATTHVMVTPDGLPTEHQTQGVKKLLSLLQTEKPHLICGDFNIPRGFNPLYEDFSRNYLDTIPTTYASSLDRGLHRDGRSTQLNAPVFDSYMVDYLFAKPEYNVHDVRLQFSVSDHAAIIATISKITSQ
jgi:endonuclease/exonuclease/phosphatase family metal-dependent hydrolase